MATAEPPTGRVIEVEDIGAIAGLVSIPVPAEGGVTELLGTNGAGKSTVLRSVEALATGKDKDKVSVHDRAACGVVRGLGATLKVMKSARRTGELEVTTLESRLDLSQFVEPGLKDAEAADAKRIKALISLTGQEAKPELFAELVGGIEMLEDLVSPKALSGDDLVQMADRIRRDLHQRGQEAEEKAEYAENHALAAKEAAAGIDVSGPSDAEALQARLEEAIRNEQKLTSDAQHAEKAKREADAAQDAIEDAESEYAGLSVTEASNQVHAWEKQVDEATDAVAAQEEFLRKAQDVLADKRRHLEKQQREAQAARDMLSSAENHQLLIAGWRATIDAPRIAPIHPDTLIEARANVDKARAACEQGVRIRDARQRLKLAEQHQAEAIEHSKRAVKLRDAARGTDDVLSKLVDRCGAGLRVKQGRLVLETKRGETFFSELSHGERWIKALDIAIPAVGEGGLLICPQEAWEAIAPKTKAEIDRRLRGTGVNMLAARVTDDERPRAEVFEAG